MVSRWLSSVQSAGVNVVLFRRRSVMISFGIWLALRVGSPSVKGPQYKGLPTNQVPHPLIDSDVINVNSFSPEPGRCISEKWVKAGIREIGIGQSSPNRWNMVL